MSNTVDKVLRVAAAEVGYLEKSASAYKQNPAVLDEKTRGAGKDNYTKYGRDMHKVYPAVMDFPAYWCDAFVDWCFYKAYGVSNAKTLLGGNFDDYTIASAQLYKNKKAWYNTPLPGDQIFFSNGQKICHTGIVYQIDANRVYTIEGNTSGASGVVSNGGGVAKKSYPLNYARIAGYGRPKYDKQEKVQTKESYFPKYSGKAVGFAEALSHIGSDPTYSYRDKIAAKNGIVKYSGTAQQNNSLLQKLREGTLKKP